MTTPPHSGALSESPREGELAAALTLHSIPRVYCEDCDDVHTLAEAAADVGGRFMPLYVTYLRLHDATEECITTADIGEAIIDTAKREGSVLDEVDGSLRLAEPVSPDR